MEFDTFYKNIFLTHIELTYFNRTWNRILHDHLLEVELPTYPLICIKHYQRAFQYPRHPLLAYHRQSLRPLRPFWRF